MFDSCLNSENKNISPSDKAVSRHLQEVVFNIQESTQDTTLIGDHILQLIRLTELYNWKDTQYFLEMAKSTFITE